MSISDWSSDVCSSDLGIAVIRVVRRLHEKTAKPGFECGRDHAVDDYRLPAHRADGTASLHRAGRQHLDLRRARARRQTGDKTQRSDPPRTIQQQLHGLLPSCPTKTPPADGRSEEHTSELQSLMRNSYALFCLKKKN